MLKEWFVCNASPRLNVSDFVSQCRYNLYCAGSSCQAGMKKRFDWKAAVRQFQPGDKVLVLLPTPGSALTAHFSGRYLVESKVLIGNKSSAHQTVGGTHVYAILTCSNLVIPEQPVTKIQKLSFLWWAPLR